MTPDKAGAVPAAPQYVLVPVEPTPEMIEAARDVKRQRLVRAATELKKGKRPDTISMSLAVDEEWAAMLAAAPKAAPAEPTELDAMVEKAWDRFEVELKRGAKATRVHAIVNAGPYPGMSEAFDAHMGAEVWTDPAYAPDASTWAAAWKAATAAAAPTVAPAEQVAPQLGMSNDELMQAWRQKLTTAEPKGQELSAFAVGIEWGWERARATERSDWNRVHHVLAKHKVHPGRTDDHLADVIDLALTATAPTVAQPLTEAKLREFALSEIAAWQDDYKHSPELLSGAELNAAEAAITDLCSRLGVKLGGGAEGAPKGGAHD